MELEVPNELQAISKTLAKRGAKAVVVGGAVRDALLKKECKDWDIEIYNIDNLEVLSSYLKAFGSVNTVGKSFGILKLKIDNYEFDFALPRKESKVAKGHRGFRVTLDATLNFKEAARRRDFTINAIGYDIESKQLLDPYEGVADLKQKILRVVDTTTFKEDPLRVYRALQFAARFSLSIDTTTKQLCKEMVTTGMLEELPKERIWGEWQKFLLKAKKPSIAFELMREFGITARYFQELNAIIGVEQDPYYHPEGDVWRHTMLSLDTMVGLLENKAISDAKLRLKLLLAIVAHDLGKAITTELIDGRIRSIGHEKAGISLTKSLLYKLTSEHKFIESILPLVEHHLKPLQLFLGKAKSAAIRRLARKVNIYELIIVAKADFLGRTTKEAQSGEFEAGEWLLKRAKELQVESNALDNIITGKDLIALGLQPSKQFKVILEDVYNELIEDRITTTQEAAEYVARKYGQECSEIRVPDSEH